MDALMNLDPTVVAFTALGLCIFALLIMLIVLIRQGRLMRRYRTLLNGNSGQNLEELLLQQQAAVEEIKQGQAVVLQRLAQAESDAKGHVQRVGVIRFNAFPDTGSDLSFAIALLDAEDNGMVISSLYGRHESRTYAKPIQKGTSTYVLTEEEQQALAVARSGKSGPA